MRRFYSLLLAHIAASYLACYAAPIIMGGGNKISVQNLYIDFKSDPIGVADEFVLLPPLMEPLIFIDYSIGGDRFARRGKIDAEPLANVITYPVIGGGIYFLLRRWRRKQPGQSVSGSS